MTTETRTTPELQDEPNPAADLPAQIRQSAEEVVQQVPAVAENARAGAAEAMRTLQGMPDHTLRLLAAGSIGFGAGLYLAGAPRIITLAGFLPAIVAGLVVAGNDARTGETR